MSVNLSPPILRSWIIGLIVMLVFSVLRVSATDNLAELRSKAEAGNALAQLKLGSRYAKGEGVAKNLAESVKWNRLAADQGVAEAQYLLGWKYQNGAGVAKDPTAAAKWYRLAAQQGHAWAQCNLGWMYHLGIGLKVDQLDAVSWLRVASSNGNILARSYLARIEIIFTPAQQLRIDQLTDERMTRLRAKP
jgi:TPR repeat protein